MGATKTQFPVDIMKATEAGVREAADIGPIAGYSLIDLKIRILSISYPIETPASEAGAKAAGALCLREAVKAAKVQLLEPIFKLEITAPDNFVGTVVGDLNSRRGKVHSMNSKPGGGGQVISADAPLSKLFGYATDLRSLTQGRATFAMEFLEYSPVPSKVKDEILTNLGRF
jgi:elongation factor G